MNEDRREPPTRPPIAALSSDDALPHFPLAVGRDGNLYLSCGEVISFLFEHLSDEIDLPRRRELERHLARCASCRDYLATYRETILLARGACDDAEPALVELPRDLFEAILQAT